MRTFPLLAALFLGCGAASTTPTTPPTVHIPAAPARTEPAPAPAEPAFQSSPAEPRQRHPRWVIAERISEHLRAASSGHRSLELEPSGRMVIKDDKQPLEEEFHLEDVERTLYEYEPGSDPPHWVKVYIDSRGAQRTRFRKTKNEPWHLVTSHFLVLPCKDKSAADEVVTLMQSLAGP